MVGGPTGHRLLGGWAWPEPEQLGRLSRPLTLRDVPAWGQAQGRETEPGVGRAKSQGSREACVQIPDRTPWDCAHLEASGSASLSLSCLFCNGSEPTPS